MVYDSATFNVPLFYFVAVCVHECVCGQNYERDCLE